MLRLLLVGALVVVLAGCQSGAGRSAASSGPVADEVTLTVFTAASLVDAFRAVEKAYEAARPEVDVVLNLAGSQQLAQQLRFGAPGDVFASANQMQMETAVEAGRVAPDAPRLFAQNRLIVIAPADNPARIERLQDLANPGLRLVLADETVPAGRYTRTVLARASARPAYGPGFEEAVLTNVASYEQNVRAVMTKVILGEADAGVVYTSDLVGPDAAVLGRCPIPDELNVAAAYPIAPVVDSRHPDEAQAFVAFVRSPEGQAVLARYGFLPPPAT